MLQASLRTLYPKLPKTLIYLATTGLIATLGLTLTATGPVTCPPRTTPATEGEFQWS